MVHVRLITGVEFLLLYPTCRLCSAANCDKIILTAKVSKVSNIPVISASPKLYYAWSFFHTNPMT